MTLADIQAITMQVERDHERGWFCGFASCAHCQTTVRGPRDVMSKVVDL